MSQNPFLRNSVSPLCALTVLVLVAFADSPGVARTERIEVTADLQIMRLAENVWAWLG